MGARMASGHFLFGMPCGRSLSVQFLYRQKPENWAEFILMIQFGPNFCFPPQLPVPAATFQSFLLKLNANIDKKTRIFLLRNFLSAQIHYHYVSGCRSRRTTGQFVQSEEKAESDRGRVKPPRVWCWLETSLTQTMRRRMTTSSAWQVHLWRLSSHNEMALWITLAPPEVCARRTSQHACTHTQISLQIFQLGVVKNV